MLFYFQTSQWQNSSSRGKDTQREGRQISGVNVKGGKGTQRQGKIKNNP